MPEAPAPAALADALREAILASGLSYNRLASLARSGSGTITNFMVGRRDMTLAVASRLCLVLGFGLTRVGPALTEPLTAPPKSNRKRPKNRPPPASAVKRGQGRRVDLEQRQVDGREGATGGAAGTGADPLPKNERPAGNPPAAADRGKRSGTRKG